MWGVEARTLPYIFQSLFVRVRIPSLLVDVFCVLTQIFFSMESPDCSGFDSRPEMHIFQQPSAAMPPMSGGLYGGPEYPQGGGEWRKVAEIGLN